ncbi:MAG TPA: DNA polymerase Y family protein [Steroidobacteraceae bacterium]|jgi:protein ImuB|nr:DNA polymerase Y family protein [Steroidobacteraceae bacterium]
MRPHLIRAAASTAEMPSNRTAEAPLRSVPSALHPAATTHELWVGVHLREFDPAQGLEALATRAQRFTPRVSLAPPDGMLLEVAGSLHLFAGVTGLRRELTEECLRLRIQPVLAFAPTPLAALTAARAGHPLVITDLAQLVGQLTPLPLSALRWPEETRARLARTGVRTIGAVLRLPRAGFARRFGVAQLAMLDALTGRSRDLRAAFHASVRFRRRRELDCELSDQGQLLAELAPLLAALGAFLTARQCGVMELECRLVHRQAPPTRCVLTLAAPCADEHQLAALFGERLNTLQLPAPVRACELRAHQLLPQLPPGRCLWQPGEHGGEAGVESGGLIDRLRARLGPEVVYGLELRQEHRPEGAWIVTRAPPVTPPVTAPRVACGRDTDAPCEAEPRRPLWLLPAPQPLAAPDGLPRRRGPLRLMSEPERIETGWWDGGEVARDYYTAIDLRGVRLWVFREREQPHRWFLHGVFG